MDPLETRRSSTLRFEQPRPGQVFTTVVEYMKPAALRELLCAQSADAQSWRRWPPPLALLGSGQAQTFKVIYTLHSFADGFNPKAGLTLDLGKPIWHDA